jgi:hypothetical protein
LYFERTALMNALPTCPGPADSMRPRANTISASEHDAEAGATAPGITTGTVSSAAADRAEAMAEGNRRLGKTLTMSDVSDPPRPARGDV